MPEKIKSIEALIKKIKKDNANLTVEDFGSEIDISLKELPIRIKEAFINICFIDYEDGTYLFDITYQIGATDERIEKWYEDYEIYDEEEACNTILKLVPCLEKDAIIFSKDWIPLL